MKLRYLTDFINMFKFPVYLLVMGNLKRKTLVEADASRWGKQGIFQLFDLLIHERNFASTFCYRCNENVFLRKTCELLFRPNRNIEINTKQIGGGLIIYHNYGCVISAEQIGINCTVSQGVTIGFGGKGDGTEKKPIIGNNVRIATNSVVIGGICVGDNAVIGAGSVVTKTVPSNAIVVGNPQKIIKYIGESYE